MRLYQLLTRAVFCAVSFALLVVAGGLIVYAGMQLVSAFSVPDQTVWAVRRVGQLTETLTTVHDSFHDG